MLVRYVDLASIIGWDGFKTKWHGKKMTRHKKHLRALRNGQKAALQMIQRTEHQGITGEETGILATKGVSGGVRGCQHLGRNSKPKWSSWKGPDIKGVESSCRQDAYLSITLHTWKLSLGGASWGKKISNSVLKIGDDHFSREKIPPCGERDSLEIELAFLWPTRMLDPGNGVVVHNVFSAC